MKRLVTFLCCFMVTLNVLYSQETFKTQIKAIDVITLFSKGNDIVWKVPVSQSEALSLRWNEQETSFAKKEGVHTFVSFQEGNLIGILSINKKAVSGEVTWKQTRIQFTTNSEGFLVIFSESKNECGVCKDGSCKPSKAGKPKLQKSSTTGENKIANRDVLFTYRLALPVSYASFTESERVFKGSIENVKNFWANIEVQLNTLFMRELGVRFEVINDERLIITDPNTNRFKADTGEKMINRTTSDLDELLGRENYDFGVVMIPNMRLERGTWVGGLAHLDGIYGYAKAGAMAVPVLDVIAHEMGHMFNSAHTFTTGGDSTYYTETGKGQSVMSYGEPCDFFSLVSIHFIRNRLAQLHYYEDKARTKLVKHSSFDHINHPFGEKIDNQPPVIDRSKLKKSYDLPEYTYFQFQIPATDPDDTELTYMAHQADIRKERQAKFITRKGTRNNIISFQPLYTDFGGFDLDATRVRQGTYTFWLGVSDGNSQKKRPVMYDVFETKVNLKEGKTFEITSPTKEVYQVGEKVTLKWNVDDKFFDANSKVRILLSDDLGKTYKYTIVEQTENDGEYEFTIPNVMVGVTTFGKTRKINLPAGVFKVEVLDHIAYAITNVAPYKISDNKRVPYGGFRIIPATDNALLPLHFVGVLPQNETVGCASSIPEALNLAVDGGCNPSVKVAEMIKNQTCVNQYVLERTYTASDNCGSTPIVHIQLITVSDNEAPTFSGELPQHISVEEDKIPSQIDLKAKDNCEGVVPIVKTREETTQNGQKVIIYTWETSDSCGNRAEHIQKITVLSQNTDEGSNPSSEGDNNQGEGNSPSNEEIIVYNGISTENTSENYLKIEPIDRYTDLYIEIFNELGQKVFQAKDYQRKGGV
ncbi:MAG: M12 family metallo-peptidase, partial [Capnocytophaga felis]|nr:M12 family metallo-peptidase [Capnocytophaga felis]